MIYADRMLVVENSVPLLCVGPSFLSSLLEKGLVWRWSTKAVEYQIHSVDKIPFTTLEDDGESYVVAHLAQLTGWGSPRISRQRSEWKGWFLGRSRCVDYHESTIISKEDIVWDSLLTVYIAQETGWTLLLSTMIGHCKPSKLDWKTTLEVRVCASEGPSLDAWGEIDGRGAKKLRMEDFVQIWKELTFAHYHC
jgi:hypothetical protein